VKAGTDVGTTAITLGTIEQGGFFGEMSLLTGEPRSATVTADGGAEVVVLSKEAIAPLLEADPTLAERLTSALVARQAKTAASIEGRRDRARDAAGTPVESNLLKRIRDFFKLPGG
jgi:CRP-like cAMP-binding protein